VNRRRRASGGRFELATPQAPTKRDHPPRPWAEDVVCALGAGWNLRGVPNHDPENRLRSDFSPVLTIALPRTGQKSDASACSRAAWGRTEDQRGKDGRAMVTI